MYARKVLIVEDHQESRESLATVLKRARFDVLEAGSLKTAFTLISDGQIAAIVTELKLSDGDGLSLLGQLKKNGLECPIVFVTAFGTMSSAIQAMLATLCSKPAATNADMGKMTAKILSVTLRPARASHTAKQTKMLQTIPLKKASQKGSAALATAIFTALIPTALLFICQ